MIRVDVKPLSINRAYKGRRFRTTEYDKYERDVMLLLPKLKIPTAPLKIILEYGLSNVLSDFDNPTKCFIDILQKKYGFNDKHIFEGVITKVKVAKGQEYIKFNISSLF